MNDSDRMELIVDNEDIYQDSENIFYIHPLRLNQVKCLSDNQFSSVTIRHTNVEQLSSINFAYILRKLKPNAQVEVILHQPITVMQDYDAKQIEANAKLAGFVNFEIGPQELVDTKTNKKTRTLVVTFEKPLKQENDIEVEVTVTKRTTSATGKDGKKGNTTNTSITANTKTNTKTTTGRK
jgi:hypothetical protein